MTTTRLICLRLFNRTLGRFAVMNALLRKALVGMLIKTKSRDDAYNASSRFFDLRDLD
ncbi:MAG: hypothetical protein NWR87_08105 [Rhodospirillales bacterium]|nr:hypothetical protein [Rhodospirillales bacterium]